MAQQKRFCFTLQDGNDIAHVFENAPSEGEAFAIVAQTFDPACIVDVVEVFTSEELAEQAAHVAMLRTKFVHMQDWAAGRGDWDAYEEALDGLAGCDEAMESIRKAREALR